MNPKIEHPKVFISYAWGSDEYQERVLTLATDLQSDGIEVLLDKWSLKEGHDTYAYMEQSVNAPDVTNVLLLLDPVYEKKADDRSGGVGTETQIISPEIYNKVTQEKFIPVVMERKDDNSVPKPHYLKGILHFDLSVAEKYDSEYQRLVKRLYGVEVYVKPELGKAPKWVTEDTPVPGSKRTAIQSLKKNNNPRLARLELVDLLNGVKNKVIAFDTQESDSLKLYEDMLPFREEYLQILKASAVIENGEILLGDFLQELYSEINSRETALQDIKQVFLHEIFIYTIAIKIKEKDFDSVAYIMNRSFFGKNYRRNNSETGFGIFYHCSHSLNNAKCAKDDKKYYSGTAQQWVENIAADYCNKREFAFADELLSNYAYFGENYGFSWPWFPISYVYDGEYDTIFQSTSSQLKSKEIAQRWAKVFGFDDYLKFQNKIIETVKELNSRQRERPRYNLSFNDAPLISDFINPEEIGTIR